MECNTVWLVVSTIGLAIFDRRNFNAPRDIEAASVGGPLSRMSGRGPKRRSRNVCSHAAVGSKPENTRSI